MSETTMTVPDVLEQATTPGTVGPLHGELSDTGYTLPEGLTYDEWADEGATLIVMARASMWWVGDWIRYGERRFPDRYEQAIDATGLALKTLQNAVWVCDRIPPSQRRRDLTFSHHKAVASLDVEPRRALLARAADEHMTEGELRGRVNNLKGGAAPTPAPIPDVLPPLGLREAAESALRRLDQAQARLDWTYVGDARALLRRALEPAA